jgi:GNAT superfamily N-acetyltransferase
VWTIEPVGERLAGLEPLARRIFGEGDRPPGWFSRKLHRECVDPDLSRVVIDDEPVGYALVGRPASLPATARTAGIGLLPAVRGRGLGLALVRDVVETTRRAGLSRLRIPAPPALVPFYARAGLAETKRCSTLLHFGRGPATTFDLGTPQPWGDRDGQVSAWLQDAWERTDPALRATVRFGDASFHIAREGLAFVCHRCRGATVEAFERLRWNVRDATPLIVVHIDPVSTITAALRCRGWADVQQTVLMEV